jgi:UDP-glucose 4-epimerase
VRVLDNFSSGSRRNLAGLEVELIEGDIRDFDVVEHSMTDIDWVFHQAGYISAPKSVDEPLDCYSVNLTGSLNILEAARTKNVAAVIMASSAAVYGEVSQPATESDRPAPLTPYAASKLAMEQAGKMYSHLFDLGVKCLRYFNVYGPRQDPQSPYAAAIPLFINAYQRGEAPILYGDGQQARDFVYVEDVVAANQMAVDCPQADGKSINIAGGASVSIRSLLEQIAVSFPDGKEPIFQPARPGDPTFSQADISKAEKLLGYRPKVGLEQGLKATVQWFRSGMTA